VVEPVAGNTDSNFVRRNAKAACSSETSLGLAQLASHVCFQLWKNERKKWDV
jgi:hypothetical protein